MVDRALAGWNERGLTVQLPLPIAEPKVYRAFRGDREVASITIGEETEQDD